MNKGFKNQFLRGWFLHGYNLEMYPKIGIRTRKHLANLYVHIIYRSRFPRNLDAESSEEVPGDFFDHNKKRTSTPVFQGPFQQKH